MTVVRAIGWVLLLPAIVVLSYGLVLWRDGVPIFEMTAGEYLSATQPESLDPIRAATQKYLPPTALDRLSTLVLPWSVAAGLALVAGVLALPGLLLLILFRRGWSRGLMSRQYRR